MTSFIITQIETQLYQQSVI